MDDVEGSREIPMNEKAVGKGRFSFPAHNSPEDNDPMGESDVPEETEIDPEVSSHADTEKRFMGIAFGKETLWMEKPLRVGYKKALLILRSKDEAKDAFQDGWRKFSAENNYTTKPMEERAKLLVQCILNEALDKYKKRKRDPLWVKSHASDEQPTISQMSNKDLKARLDQTIALIKLAKHRVKLESQNSQKSEEDRPDQKRNLAKLKLIYCEVKDCLCQRKALTKLAKYRYSVELESQNSQKSEEDRLDQIRNQAKLKAIYREISETQGEDGITVLSVWVELATRRMQAGDAMPQVSEYMFNTRLKVTFPESLPAKDSYALARIKKAIRDIFVKHGADPDFSLPHRTRSIP